MEAMKHHQAEPIVPLSAAQLDHLRSLTHNPPNQPKARRPGGVKGLADRIGVQRGTIYEMQTRRACRLSTYLALCAYLGPTFEGLGMAVADVAPEVPPEALLERLAEMLRLPSLPVAYVMAKAVPGARG